MIKEHTWTSLLLFNLAVEMNMTNTTLIPNLNKVIFKKFSSRLTGKSKD